MSFEFSDLFCLFKYFKEIDLCNKAKLLSIASCIFNNFGTSADIENLIISGADDDESKFVNNLFM